jgi:hypothetical protein
VPGWWELNSCQGVQQPREDREGGGRGEREALLRSSPELSSAGA